MRGPHCLLFMNLSHTFISVYPCSHALQTRPAVYIVPVHLHSPCHFLYCTCQVCSPPPRCAQAGEPDRALQAFRGLQRSGLQPNLVTWCVRYERPCSLINCLGAQRAKRLPAHAAPLFVHLGRLSLSILCSGESECSKSGDSEHAYTLCLHPYFVQKWERNRKFLIRQKSSKLARALQSKLCVRAGAA